MAKNLTEKAINYSIEPHRMALDLRKSVEKPVMNHYHDLGQLLVWRGIKILIIGDCTAIQEIPVWFDFVLLVEDDENKCYHDQILFRKLVDMEGERYQSYDINSEGAFVYNL